MSLKFQNFDLPRILIGVKTSMFSDQTDPKNPTLSTHFAIGVVTGDIEKRPSKKREIIYCQTLFVKKMRIISELVVMYRLFVELSQLGVFRPR